MPTFGSPALIGCAVTTIGLVVGLGCVVAGVVLGLVVGYVRGARW